MSAENQQTETISNPQTKKQCSLKQNAIPILNIILFLGLIVLYIINFLPNNLKHRDNIGKTGVDTLTTVTALRIAFVNSDTLMQHYLLAQSMRDQIEAEQRRMETDFQRRERNFQTELEVFQRQIQSNTITMENAQRKEQELMAMRDELVRLNETYTADLMRKELEMNRELYGRISDFLDRYSKEKGYDYILGFSEGGGILYASQKHDITQNVLVLLNDEYKAEN